MVEERIDPAAGSWPAGPLVVGYHDRDTSQETLQAAQDLARTLHRPLRVVHVIDLEDFPVDPDSAAWEEGMEAREAHLLDRLRSLLDLPDTSWTVQIVRGDPVKALAREADRVEASMVVVGEVVHTHAVGPAVARLVSGGRAGSVGSRLVRHGHRPVLIVPVTRSV